MKILYVAQWAGAEKYGMVYGHYYLAKEWVKEGHEVTVLAASYSHTRFSQPTASRFCFSQEVIDGIRYVWVPVNRYSSGSKFGRLLSMFLFSLVSFFYRSKALYDVVISSSHHPFSIFASRFHALRLRAKLVFEVRDLWPASLIYLAKVSESSVFIRLMAWSESYAYRHSDLVITTLENSYTYMAERGLTEERFFYVPNGVASTHECVSIDKRVSDGRFKVVYCGNIGLANNLRALVLAGELLDPSEFEILIVGDGPELDALKSMVTADSCVVFSPRVAKKAIPTILKSSDLAFLSYAYSPLYEYGVSPTKLGDYSAAQLPILFSADFDLGEIERESFLFRCSDNSSDVAEKISELSKIESSDLEVSGRAGRDWIRDNRSYSKIAAKVLLLFES